MQNAIYEPHHDKTNKMTCAPSEDSDLSGQIPTLIQVFSGRTGHFVGFVMMQLSYVFEELFYSLMLDQQAKHSFHVFLRVFG